jgi:3-oxoacyl-[acyl-carrier protein] reductase
MRIDLSGRVAVVTGGSRGIGRAIAGALAECGAKVAVVGRDAERAQAAAAEIGDSARAYACDITQTEAVDALIPAIERDLGSLDILVNNAGVTRDNLLMRLKDSDWADVLDANLRGAFVVTRAVMKGSGMLKRRWGRIINISSIVGLIGNKGQANYAASKAGLIGFTKAVARELASRNVLVNVVAPGYIATDMTDAMTADARTALEQRIPLERLGTPADVSGTVAFLASDAAAYITGAVFVVDGGLAM